jgi:hypothetical protein
MEAGFQKSVWLNGAGDDWFQRNKDKLGERDLASDAIEALKITPEKVLEIGCANGWRLKKLQEKYECMVWGIEPSTEARQEAQIGGLNVYSGTADNLSTLRITASIPSSRLLPLLHQPGGLARHQSRKATGFSRMKAISSSMTSWERASSSDG